MHSEFPSFPVVNQRRRHRPVARHAFLYALAILWTAAGSGWAATLTWDATAGGTLQDGGGSWLDSGQWNNGSPGSTWVSGDDAIFGVGGTGGEVVLASPTTANSITLQPFNGTYVLGSTGQFLLLNNGITVNPGSGAVSLISPITLGASQTWVNHSTNPLSVSAGTLSLGGNLLLVAGIGSTTISSAISGAGSLGVLGPGTATLSGISTFTDGTTVNGGTLALAAGGAAGTIRGVLNIDTGATVNLTAPDALGVINGLSVATVNIVDGTLNIAANANQGYHTDFTLTGGEIKATGGGSLHFGPSGRSIRSRAHSNLAAVRCTLVLRNTGTLTVETAPGATSNGVDLSISGLITENGGPGSLVKTGAGTLELTHQNVFTGGTTVMEGRLALSSGGGAGPIRGALNIQAGATVDLATADALGISAGVTASPVNIEGGTLNIAVNANQGYNTDFLLTGGAITSTGGGSLHFGPVGRSISTRAHSTSANIQPALVIRNGATLTVATASGSTASGVDLRITGPIVENGGAGNLLKTGSGTLVLSGSSTFTGACTVAAGTLFVQGNHTLATGTLSVAANATLGGQGSLGGNVVMASGSRLEFDLSTPAAGHNPLDLAPGKTFSLSGDSSLTITSSGGVSAGAYVLVSAPGGLAGVAPATVNLPPNLTASVAIVGNQLVLNVTAVGPSARYADWQAANGTTQPVDGDHDGDGVHNGIEWFLHGAGNSTGADASPGVFTDAAGLTVTWTRDSAFTAAYGTGFAVEIAQAPGGPWTPVALGSGVVTVGKEVRYTFSGLSGERQYARLKVSGPSS